MAATGQRPRSRGPHRRFGAATGREHTCTRGRLRPHTLLGLAAVLAAAAAPGLATGRCWALAPGYRHARPSQSARRASEKEGEAKPAEEAEDGYQFGDLILNKITGKKKYEFGDLSRWIGGQLEDKAKEFTGKDSYEFGDISRRLDEMAKDKVNEFTGQEEYEFGDVTRALERMAKERAMNITGKDTYEFGDLSRFLDQQAKEKVSEWTGKEMYEVGDITKEVARRVSEGEVSSEDMSLLLRMLVTAGVGLSPVAHLLPVKTLVDVLSFNLEGEDADAVPLSKRKRLGRRVGRRAGRLVSHLAVKAIGKGKWNRRVRLALDTLGLRRAALIVLQHVLLPMARWTGIAEGFDAAERAELAARATGALTAAVAEELDRRAKLQLLGREEYQLGDFTKEKLAESVQSFTGKEEYEFGDITRSILARMGTTAEEVTAEAMATPLKEVTAASKGAAVPGQGSGKDRSG